MTRRSPLVILVVLLVSLVAFADKADLKKQILGRWQPAKDDTTVIEFQSDSTFVVTVTMKQDTEKLQGTYKWLDASTVEVTLSSKDETKTEKLKVAITGDTMSTTTSKGKVEKFNRIKK